MADMTRKPDGIKRYSGSSWSAWSNYSDTTILDESRSIQNTTPIALRIPVGQVKVTRLDLSVTLSAPRSNVTITAELYQADPASGTAIASASYSMTPSSSTSHSFSMSGVSINTISGYVYVKLSMTTGDDDVRLSTASAQVTYDAIPLSVSVSPASVYVDGSPNAVSLNFNGTRLGKTLTVKLFYNNTQLGNNITVNSDNPSITAAASWFTQAGVSGDSMRVSVHVSDSDGRQNNNAYFTVLRHASLTPTFTQPQSSGSYDGGQTVPVSWTLAGDGTQTKAELQYSTDNTNWRALTTLNDDRATWYTSLGFFPAGQIYLRLRVTSSYGAVSAWVTTRFTVAYNAPTVSLTTPTSGSKNGAEQITFSWTIARGSGSVVATELQYSSDAGASWETLQWTTQVTAHFAQAGTFPAGALRWRVRAKDSYSQSGTDGWSAWQTANITITYAAPTVSLTAPTSGSKDGGQSIQFVWAITDGGGNITGTQMRYSADAGVTWTLAFDSSGKNTTKYVAPGVLPGGSVRWQVRVKDSYTGWTQWQTANFTVAYTAPTITLTTPTGGSRDGAEKIIFGWDITRGSGDIERTKLEISTDDGLSWSTLMDSPGKIITYEADVAQFPAGLLRWRVSAEAKYTGWSTPKASSVTVTYSAVSQTVAVNSPTSGRINAAAAQTFSVRLEPSAPVHDPFTVDEATFYWRAGSSGEYTPVSMTPSGATASVTIQAGTFPSGTIEWYAAATDNTARETETPVYTITTLNAAVEASPLSPVNTIESLNGEITFVWSYISLDGSEQSRAVLEYSRTGSSWSTLADIAGNETSYTTGKGFFQTAGPVYWRVTAYNAAGQAGPVSAAVSFSAFGASIVDGVTGDGKPFLTVSWQTEGQVAYEVEVDGKKYGPYFGDSARAYTLSEPLPDGAHIARVRVQNRFSLWSEWAEGNVSVQNVSGPVVWMRGSNGESVEIRLLPNMEAPTITSQPTDAYKDDGPVNFVVQATQATGAVIQPNFAWEYRDPGANWQPYTGTDAHLNGISFAADQTLDGRQFRCRVYNTVGELYSRVATYHFAPAQVSPLIKGTWRAETGYFLIYRDGKLLTKTFNPTFTDKTSLGDHRYYAFQVLPAGYYTRAINPGPPASYFLDGKAEVSCPVIAPLDDGDFMELKLSTDADRAQDFSRNREIQYIQYSGQTYPSAERGEHETMTATFDAAYLQSDRDLADMFEALVGLPVILKTPGGKVVIGVLEGYDLHDPKFYKSYRCSLTQMDFPDFFFRDIKVRYRILRNGGFYARLRALGSSSPSIRGQTDAQIKTSLTGGFSPIPVDMDGRPMEANWLTDEIQPVLVIDDVEHELGVYIPTTCAITRGVSVSLSIEAYDRGQRVLETNSAQLLFWPAGTLYLDAVEQLLSASGISTVYKTPSSAALTEDREDWPAGTPYLTVINDLLAEINYKSLWFDASGAAILEPAAVPEASQIKHILDAADPSTQVMPVISRSSDYFRTPNVFEVYVANPDKGVNMRAVSINDSPQSPLSTVRRGQRIVQVTQLDNVSTQAELQAFADRQRDESLITGEQITVTTGLQPGWGIGDVVGLHFPPHSVTRYTRAGKTEIEDDPELTSVCLSREFDMDLRTGGSMRHVLERVIYNLE